MTLSYPVNPDADPPLSVTVSPHPGVSLKTWNIYLKEDGLEENHETFNVVLKEPKNAVLGQRSSASVEIIDPRGGGS